MTKVTARAVENLDVLHRLATPAEGDTGAGVGRELGRDKSNFAKTLGLLRGDGLVGEGLELTPAGQRVVRLFRPDGEIRVPGDMLELRHRELEPDPENERSEIPATDVDDMAASLGERGQLQPIRVRLPAKPGGKHRILIGELRWRGVGLAIERGAWPADRPLRCQLVSETDALQLVLMRMDENLRRHDLHELDEGRGFKRLRDEFGRSTAQIAELFGRSRRHVQDRIFVFENTDAATQARMRLPEKDARHVRYTDARDDATSHKPTGSSSPLGPDPASPPPPPQPAGEGVGSRALSERELADVASLDLTPAAQLALAELAHKIDATTKPGQERVAAVYGFANDRAAGQLGREGLAIFVDSTRRGHIVGIVTTLGRARLAAKPIGARRPYKTAWLIDPPPPAGALAYEGAADVLRAVARWPSNTALESAVSMTLNSTAIARRLDGLAREGLIDRPRAATITAAGLRALEALDAPARRTEPFDPPSACMVCRGSVGRRVTILGREIACPICNGGSWLDALVEPPPAQTESDKPRSEAHALVGDDFSRQLREAAATEAEPPQGEPVDDAAAPADRAVPYVELGRGGDIGLFLPGVGLAVALTADEARTLARALAGAADQVEWDPPSAGGTGHDLSGAQRASLLLLLKAGAIGRDCAKTAYGDLRPLNPSVLARLWKRGLTDSRARTEKGRSLTVYWLTEAGAAAARQLAEQA